MINSISIVIPLFNEQKSIPTLINQLKKIKKSKFFLSEIILVNDGSTDDTLKNIKKLKDCKIITYSKNRGKGYALKRGVYKARYKWVLTADADCSVNLSYFLNWFKFNLIEKKINIYFGSRNLKQSKVKSKLMRLLLGKFLNSILYHFLKFKIQDTQCGYKLYRTDIAKKIFKNLTIYDFSHDIQLYNIGLRKNYLIRELPVKWKHKSNSKVFFLRDIPRFFLTIFKIKYDFQTK